VTDTERGLLATLSNGVVKVSFNIWQDKSWCLADSGPAHSSPRRVQTFLHGEIRQQFAIDCTDFPCVTIGSRPMATLRGCLQASREMLLALCRPDPESTSRICRFITKCKGFVGKHWPSRVAVLANRADSGSLLVAAGRVNNFSARIR